MGILRFLVWTITCVGLGIGLGTVEVGGKTAVQHAEKLWHTRAPKLREGAGDLVDDVKRRVTQTGGQAQVGQPARAPTEQHSAADRDAVDQIIAHHQR